MPLSLPLCIGNSAFGPIFVSLFLILIFSQTLVCFFYFSVCLLWLIIRGTTNQELFENKFLALHLRITCCRLRPTAV